MKMYMQKYPCVYMRGGTSKAVFFHEKDLPEDKNTWDEIFMKVMGTPDVKQIDGMGGKMCIRDRYMGPHPRNFVIQPENSWQIIQQTVMWSPEIHHVIAVSFHIIASQGSLWRS